MQTATGNFTIAVPDLAGIARTYTSLDETAGPLGRGWTLNLSIHLSFDGDDVTLHDEDGRELLFEADGDGYRRPADIEADLTRGSDGGFVLRFTAGTARVFDADGRAEGHPHVHLGR